MPLLLLPLGLMVLLALWLVLFPWSLWQRYRRGKATRRVWPWQVRLNLGLLGVAIAVFLLISAVLQHWWPHQLSQAALGLGAGIALGMLGIATSRFEWREAGCSMCLAMNPDKLKPQERCASTSNRNFEGRQGKGGRTHLVSPAMAAAAAISGHFVDIRQWNYKA